MGSDDIHDVLGLKSYEIQWGLMGFMGFRTYILWNPMGSDGIHEVLGLKSYDIQWDMMGFMRF